MDENWQEVDLPILGKCKVLGKVIQFEGQLIAADDYLRQLGEMKYSAVGEALKKKAIEVLKSVL